MEMTYKDRSNYFIGMLILIGKDGKITEPEKVFIRYVGKILDFEPIYCEENIKNVLKMKNIKKEPLKFSNQNVAKVFIKDAIKIAFADYNLHPNEFCCLQSIVNKNKISMDWFMNQLFDYVHKNNYSQHLSLEIKKYWKNDHYYDLEVKPDSQHWKLKKSRILSSDQSKSVYK